MDTKNCTICNVIKPISEFGTRPVGKNKTLYHFGQCKKCKKSKDYERSKLRPKTESEIKWAAYIARLKRERRLDPSLDAKHIYEDSGKGDRRKKRDNDLTLDFVREQIDQGCSYCGTTTGRMTLDRIDTTLGHLQSNVVPACYRCNLVRGDMPYQAWLVVAPALKQAQEAGLLGEWKTRPISRKRVT